MSGQGDPFIEKIVLFHKNDDTTGILNVFRECAFSQEKGLKDKLHLVTWPLPMEKDLEHFAQFVVSQKVSRIYSIGCGSGLLEWIMLKFVRFHELTREKISNSAQKCTNKVQLTGIEVDMKWWNSSYSPPIFIPLEFYGETFYIPDEGFGEESDLAIFCYFNNLTIFVEYLSKFRGNWVVLIGPVSCHQFCAPGPRELAENHELPTKEWKLLSFEQFGFISIDHLAIYKRV